MLIGTERRSTVVVPDRPRGGKREEAAIGGLRMTIEYR
jgi:hypothetical protein